MRVKAETKYLGCKLNQRNDPAKELQQRLADCIITLKNLDLFWLHGDCSRRQKLLIYNAVIRSKTVYGLESIQLNKSTMKRLDEMQLKGLRKIMNMDTIYGNMQTGRARENTNEEIFRRVKLAVKEEVDANCQPKAQKRIPPQINYSPTEWDRWRMMQWQRRVRAEHFKYKRQLEVQRLSSYYRQTKIQNLGKMIRGDTDDMVREACLNQDTFKAVDHGKKRVGRPRDKWLDLAIQDFWDEVVHQKRPVEAKPRFDPDNPWHSQQIKRVAQDKKETYITIP